MKYFCAHLCLHSLLSKIITKYFSHFLLLRLLLRFIGAWVWESCWMLRRMKRKKGVWSEGKWEKINFHYYLPVVFYNRFRKKHGTEKSEITDRSVKMKVSEVSLCACDKFKIPNELTWKNTHTHIVHWSWSRHYTTWHMILRLKERKWFFCCCRRFCCYKKQRQQTASGCHSRKTLLVTFTLAFNIKTMRVM
jgi:hypothetical protein